MPKTRSNLNKTSLTELNKFYRELRDLNEKFDQQFFDRYTELVKHEVKSLKDCTEKSVVDNYIIYGIEFLIGRAVEFPISDNILDAIKRSVTTALLKEYTDKNFTDSIDIYFNEVKREYIKHPQNESDSLQFVPENRDIFIKNNLKLVVSVAKKYQNLGLPFEDLIQAGNVGLLTAFERFDTSRASLRNAIIKDINSSDKQQFSKADADEILDRNFKYDKESNKSLSAIPDEGFSNKLEFIGWVNKNVKTAVFASVAFQWIRAAIIQELDRYSTIVKFPKKAKEEAGASIIYLDSINPYTEDNYNDNELFEVTNEEFVKEDENLVNAERDELFKDILADAFATLNVTDRRIIKKKFGIGFPYALSNQEIAENEKMTASEVKTSISRAMKKIAEFITPETKDLLIEMMS